jgi:hypothetical protein
MSESPRLLDQVRYAIRLRHYSFSTERTYVHWIKSFILDNDKRHPRDMGFHGSIQVRESSGTGSIFFHHRSDQKVPIPGRSSGIMPIRAGFNGLLRRQFVRQV